MGNPYNRYNFKHKFSLLPKTTGVSVYEVKDGY